MTAESQSEVRERIVASLSKLTDEEQQLLKKVLRIEREFLHMDRPRVKEPILAAVREQIK